MKCCCPDLPLLEAAEEGHLNGDFHGNLMVPGCSNLTDGKTWQYLIVYEVCQLLISKIWDIYSLHTFKKMRENIM